LFEGEDIYLYKYHVTEIPDRAKLRVDAVKYKKDKKF